MSKKVKVKYKPSRSGVFRIARPIGKETVTMIPGINTITQEQYESLKDSPEIELVKELNKFDKVKNNDN